MKTETREREGDSSLAGVRLFQSLVRLFERLLRRLSSTTFCMLYLVSNVFTEIIFGAEHRKIINLTETLAVCTITRPCSCKAVSYFLVMFLLSFSMILICFFF